MQERKKGFGDLLKIKEMTKYVPRRNYALDYGTAWPRMEVISFGIKNDRALKF